MSASRESRKWERQQLRYSGNATYVIRVLVGDQNGIDISDINIDLIKTG